MSAAQGQAAVASRECACCGRPFYKRQRDSSQQWSERRYCSVSCHNKSTPFRPVHLRYWEYVIKRSEDECWGWGGTKSFGYGALGMPGQSPAKAHRVSWEMHNGPIPEGMHICHTCDNPECTNPQHLFLGTAADNARDCQDKGRRNPVSYLNLNHEKKLTAEQVEEIKRVRFVGKNGRGPGETVKDVADRFGVCEDLIRAVKYGRYEA